MGYPFTTLEEGPETQREGDPARLTAVGCWPMGNNKEKKCEARKRFVCTELTRAAKTGKNILYRHDQRDYPLLTVKLS
jgi:hypothetical protein